MQRSLDKVLEGQAQMMVELTNQRERTFRLAGKEQEQTVKIDGLESEIRALTQWVTTDVLAKLRA